MSEIKKTNSIIPSPRKEVKDMNSYSAPLENRRNLLRLDFNENTIGPSPKVLEALKNSNFNEISIYPEYEELINKIISTYSTNRIIDRSQIGIFNGADAAINAIFKTFGENNKIFLTTNPTFGYYFPCAQMQGMKTILCSYLKDDFQFPYNEFEDKIKEFSPKLIFICNPNNPTGTILSPQEIIKLSQINKKSLIVVDELYEKFYGESLLEIINFEKIKNIIIIQSLSKTAGLAGLRIGFTFGNAEVIKYINKVTGPYDVNSFAVLAAIAALNDKEYIDEYVSKVKESRNWIMNKFKSIEIRSHFSGGNYFLIWPNKSPSELEMQMRKRGILIRNMNNKKDLEGSIRISIGTKDQMRLLWQNYKEIDLK